MATFHKALPLADLPPGACTAVDVGGTAVALFNVGGTIHATRNECAHRQGPLGEGWLDDRIVTCPWHGWQYDVTTGRCTNNPAAAVPLVPVRVEGGDILVEV